jgi:hypothetical protein
VLKNVLRKNVQNKKLQKKHARLRAKLAMVL